MVFRTLRADLFDLLLQALDEQLPGLCIFRCALYSAEPGKAQLIAHFHVPDIERERRIARNISLSPRCTQCVTLCPSTMYSSCSISLYLSKKEKRPEFPSRSSFGFIFGSQGSEYSRPSLSSNFSGKCIRREYRCACSRVSPTNRPLLLPHTMNRPCTRPMLPSVRLYGFSASPPYTAAITVLSKGNAAVYWSDSKIAVRAAGVFSRSAS